MTNGEAAHAFLKRLIQSSFAEEKESFQDLLAFLENGTGAIVPSRFAAVGAFMLGIATRDPQVGALFVTQILAGPSASQESEEDDSNTMPTVRGRLH